MKPTLILSLDFELFWGMQDAMPLSQYEANVLGGRKAIPKLLDLFQKYGIHATWATVGFQFARDLEELKAVLPPKALRPDYSQPELSTYRCLTEIGKNEAEAPCFFAPSLVEQISKYPHQEIGSHTFCHYYCKDPKQTAAQFEADVKASVELAQKKGYELKSVVFPRNQASKEYLEILCRYGFTSFRDLENDWIHQKIPIRIVQRACILMDMYFPLVGFNTYLPKQEGGLVNLMGSRMYRPYFKPLGWFEWLKMARIKGEMRHAAKHGQCYHLWWHPHNIGVRTEYHLEQLEALFRYYQKLQKKYGMRSLNMEEAASEFLLQQ